jgi:hypothetical protein
VVRRKASGTPALTELTAAGNSVTQRKATGSPSIAEITGSGTATIPGVGETRTASGNPSIPEITVSAEANRPRVWLNTTQTKAGATEMTVTAWNSAGTSITFTDPVGAPFGSLYLGVENVRNSDIGWIAVTVGGLESASAAVSIPSPTSSGITNVLQGSEGIPSIPEITAVGQAVRIEGFPAAQGNAVVTEITASGTSIVRHIASAPTSIKRDTFTEAGDTALASHTSDTGGSWQGAQVGQLYVLGATDDVANTLDGTSQHGALCDESFVSSSYIAEIEGTTGSPGAYRFGVICRGQDGASFKALGAGNSEWYGAIISASQGWQLWRVEADGGVTVIAWDHSWLAANDIDADDPIRLRLTTINLGSSVNLKLDVDFNKDGAGFSGYFPVVDTIVGGALQISDAGQAGIYMDGVEPRITYFDSRYVADAPTIPEITASGTATGVPDRATGAVTLTEITASGTALGPPIRASGAPSVETITASGTAVGPSGPPSAGAGGGGGKGKKRKKFQKRKFHMPLAGVSLRDRPFENPVIEEEIEQIVDEVIAAAEELESRGYAEAISADIIANMARLKALADDALIRSLRTSEAISRRIAEAKLAARINELVRRRRAYIRIEHAQVLADQKRRGRRKELERKRRREYETRRARSEWNATLLLNQPIEPYSEPKIDDDADLETIMKLLEEML